MELDEIVRYIISEGGNEREIGFSNLELLSTEEQKQVIELALEAHIKDDRLLEYNDSCRAAAELIRKIGQEDYASKFHEYVKELYSLSVNIPTSKAKKIADAAIWYSKLTALPLTD